MTGNDTRLCNAMAFLDRQPPRRLVFGHRDARVTGIEVTQGTQFLALPFAHTATADLKSYIGARLQQNGRTIVRVYVNNRLFHNGHGIVDNVGVRLHGTNASTGAALGTPLVATGRRIVGSANTPGAAAAAGHALLRGIVCHRRLRRLALATAAGVIAAACVATPASAEASEYSGTCEQVAAIVPADADAVRAYIPPGWPLYEAAGKASLLLTGGSCRDSIQGGPQDFENRFGLASALGGPPDGRLGGGEGYDIRWLHSSPAEVAMFRDAGFAASRVPATSVTVSEGLGSITGEANVPWRRSPFSVRVRTTPTWTPPQPITTYHWHASRDGLSLLRPDHTGLTLSAGAGEVTVAPGSPLARMLGGTRATGAGGILRFSFAATIGPAPTDQTPAR